MGNAPQLLIVEDEAMVAEIITRTLAMHKFTCNVVRVASAEEGLAHYDAMLEQGNILAGIMVDYSLPGMNGGEFLRQVAELSAARNIVPPPAVYMSGYDLQSEGNAPAYAPLEFLCKPFSVGDILPLAQHFLKLPK